MPTKPMLIICSWCQSRTRMDQNKLWWNFDDPIWADPIGYCSEVCIKQAQAMREVLRKHVVEPA